MKKILIGLIAVVLLAGCTSKKEAQFKTQLNAENPEFVCEIQGQKLYRIEVVRTGTDHNHWVYFFDKSKVVTLNHEERKGKVTVNEVEVSILP